MSKKPQRYCQCLLERKTKTGITILVSYIPEQYIKHGVLKLQDDYGYWTNGWVIKSSGEPIELLDTPQQAIKAHRQRTGDSLPKKPPEKEE